MSKKGLVEGKITEEALEQLRSRVGIKLRIHPDSGNRNIFEETIRRFVNGTGDINPLYRDIEYAQKTRYGKLVAPPSWLYSVFQMGVMQGLAGVQHLPVVADGPRTGGEVGRLGRQRPLAQERRRQHPGQRGDGPEDEQRQPEADSGVGERGPPAAGPAGDVGGGRGRGRAHAAPHEAGPAGRSRRTRTTASTSMARKMTLAMAAP